MEAEPWPETPRRQFHDIHEFNKKQILQEWIKSYQKGDLLSSLKHHWKSYVPFVYAGNHETGAEERLAAKFLFCPMEEFICNGNPEEVFRTLKEKDKPSQICGHGFKTGEPTYSCRDCATDPTCVLCINCFQKSSHKQHRYRMSTSGGGGYCDCGDLEAWKMDPFCEEHKPRMEGEEDLNPMDLLPVDLSRRAKVLFLSTLQFCVDMLTWEECVHLPDGLEIDKDQADLVFHCMLFNDEVHTYDQVIQTLQKAIECTQTDAVEFATVVDREGRSSVLKGTTKECTKAKEIIQRSTSRHGSKPLKVQVMHSSVVAHQQFALKLLQWLQDIISKSDGLRRLFCLLSMESDNGDSLMEKLLLADTMLWKAGRIQSHQLLMSGVLMDQECKKRFAIIFTKNYRAMMAEFFLDDHDHDVSVLSLTVQIFTVPSLARVLITKYNLLEVIIRAFLEPCERKKNVFGKLAFDRNERNPALKRAWFVLYDLKYALICKPNASEWDNELRINFLKGLKALIELLSAMQGMDCVQRQTGHHLEFEPEWEGAFNLQLKLEDNLVLFAEWCSTDKEVLLKAYKETLDALYRCERSSEPNTKERFEVEGHTARCIKYDVATQPVSIHLPLSRFLAALHLHLEKYQLHFNSPKLLQIMDKRLEPLDLIEPPLRTQVMIAQTQAGMWRRNGFSLLNQIFFYQNVRCRGEMYDRDIVMLQIGGSLMNGNDFVIHLLNKYGLMNWVRLEYDVPGQGQEDSLRQTVMLAEEFLNLLIILLEERFVPGVGQVTEQDVVKREIIHQLCIAPMAHSELGKALPENPNHETGMEDVVKDVAKFNKPSGTGKGKYELKPEYFKNYCPYFYHYTKSEQSKSEEAQRKRKKQEGEDQCLPPPFPPAFTCQFSSIINLLQCDVVTHIFQTILTRTGATRSRSWSEPQFERVLYLIGLALHEQVRAYGEKNTSFDFVKYAMQGDNSILSLLQSLVNCNNVSQDPSKDLLAWVLRKFAEVRMMKNDPIAMEGLENISNSTDQKSETERKKKAEIAAKKRAKVMAKISKMQKDFIKGNAVLFESTCSEMQSAGSDMDLSGPTSSDFPVALGQSRNNAATGNPIMATCILCQEEHEVTVNGKAMVLAAYVQRSTVLSQNLSKHLENGDEYDPLYLTSDLFTGTKTGSCGHIMHHECWQKYFDVILAKERRRPLRFRQAQSYDIDKMEYLCPLCEALSNTVIPIVPSLHKLVNDSDCEVDLKFDDWLDGIKKTVENSVQKEKDQQSQEESLFIQPCPISTITRMMAESVAKNFQLLWEYVYDDASGCFSEGMREMMKKFARDVYSFGLDVQPDDENARVPIMAWSTCAFTIHTIEQTLQLEKKPLFGAVPSRQLDLLSSLVKYAAVCSQVMSPDTVKQHCVRVLTALIPEQLEKLKKDSPCILDLDMFHYLVILGMTLPTLYAEQQRSSISTIPSGGLNDKHALQLVLTAHLVQILLTYNPEPEENMEMEGDIEGENWLRIYFNLREDAGIRSEISPSPWQLCQHIRKACSPFLRCATILYHHLTGIMSPPELQTDYSDREGFEFEILCKYLSLPSNLSVLLDNSGQITTALIKSWCMSPLIKERMSASSEPIITYPTRINQLVELPDDFSELINQASKFTCPKSDGDDSRAPTMCLVCGMMLCSQSYCCRTDLPGSTTPVGAATAHAHYCGAGVGIFLRVRDCQVLLLSGRIKGCFIPPPYLDDYGETDQGLRRGYPLHLCRDRYKQLHQLWFKHSIPETIAHNIESNNNFVAIEWHNL
ncbi:E3 ubiquitin-protein ligase UBR2 isoform X1 [Patella vulgata]|uniref:E3 ubiquitin-protein ligase UBR2 isoform X1 n=1 Tax=Patella vulgata TaxID=6465 RepID=UPI0024A86A01|nr:E3 ubiquitin-protein ligase UBR2 isoform X1 [Patella vulgata]